jgi:hypothetical protein
MMNFGENPKMYRDPAAGETFVAIEAMREDLVKKITEIDSPALLKIIVEDSGQGVVSPEATNLDFSKNGLLTALKTMAPDQLERIRTILQKIEDTQE